ncbi:MAG TPA: EAL domain-containing protein, partial [Crinalium sp.]
MVNHLAKRIYLLVKRFGDRRRGWSHLTLLVRHPIILASVLVTGGLLVVRQFGGLEPLELAVYDQMVRLLPDQGSDPRLLVVAITESDIQRLQEWPLSDQIVAQLLERLQQDQPAVIGVDLYRDIPHPPGNAALRKQLQANNVITITKLVDENGEVPPPPGVPETRVGFNDVVVDADGILRRNLMFAALGEKGFYSFSLRLSLVYLSNKGIYFQGTPQGLQIGQTMFVPLEPNTGGYQRADTAGYQVLLRYRSRQAVKQVSVNDVLTGKMRPEWVRGNIVLIGTTAPSGKDLFFTPYSAGQEVNSQMPGVVIHAQNVSQILSAVLDHQPQFWFWDEWAEILWAWGWAIAGGFLAWRIRYPMFLGISSLSAVVMLFSGGYIVFTQAGWIPLMLPALAFIASTVGVLSYKVLYNTFHDPLTGLPNRVWFIRQLRSALTQLPLSRTEKSSPMLAVLFLDLDRFKLVNEGVGYEAGDQLLIAAGERLRTHLRYGDKLARVGGDEFAILLRQIHTVDEATRIANRLQQMLKQPYSLCGQEIITTVSIGIAVSQQGYQHHAKNLLRDAHTAMYRAKALGKSHYEVYATGMRVNAASRLRLETTLHQAIERQEFQLYYQPVIHLHTGKLIGFEALVRWQHPEHGCIYPNEFIPVAEETGLIVPLGRWVLEEACRQTHLWQQQFPLTPPLAISVNLSSKQFLQSNLVEQIAQVLETTGLDGRCLKLEITESTMMNDVEAAIALLLRLKSLNLQIGIDDFGTGYSSLSYLHRLPIDSLKIDRSFVGQMDQTSENAEIVRTIVVLGHNLGMDVTSEGVETVEQMEMLRSLNCEYGQGYWFAKP